MMQKSSLNVSDCVDVTEETLKVSIKVQKKIFFHKLSTIISCLTGIRVYKQIFIN